MANPQKENGYVAISSELYDAMALFRISGECEQVLKIVIRKTYGYNKKEDAIANSQFVKGTGLSKGNVSRALSKLITNKVVIKTDNNKRTGNIYKLNKDYSQWIPFVIKSDNKKKPKKLLSKKKPLLSKVITPVIKSDNYLLSEVRDTIDNNHLTKDTIQKTEKTPKEFLEGSQWNELIDPFEKVNPMFKNFYRNKTERQALQDMTQEIGFQKLKWLIEHLKEAVSKPYAPKITKPTELMRDMGKLIIFWEQEKNKRSEITSKGRGIA